MQTQNGIYFTSSPTQSDIKQHKTAIVTPSNLLVMSVYFAVRHCIEATWINDCDRFLHPSNEWDYDNEFKYDCLIFSLLHGQNRISSLHGENHWIPFNEPDVGAKEKFESNFMCKFIANKNKAHATNLFDTSAVSLDGAIVLSQEAKAVLVSGMNLWKYYHSIDGINVNASFYDIRAYFQGRDKTGKMNNKSANSHYTNLITDLRAKIKVLADKIEPKVYEYGFLK